MSLTAQPGTIQPLVFSNDAGTLLEIVSPDNPLPVTGSFTPSGTQTVIPVKSTTFTASQVTVPATTNGILLLAANANRLGATISNPGSSTIYVSSAATGLTTSNGFAIPAGWAYNIDSPLYTGALYGIISTGTETAYIVELT